MLRNELNSAMKDALKKNEQKTLSTIRLILAALKDRDIVARGKGNSDGISDEEVLSMLQSMIKQRRDSIAMYEQAGRCDLAEGEEAEIGVITSFMPKQLSDEEINTCVKEAIVKLNASSLKDMGKIMSYLKERYLGRMDFGKASSLVKENLV
ncbi:MAG: GatB/YqeY domain-containing protein [Pseudomonadota bacterium]|nr:GatB/YqeY domain-containing protein [Pseudomonadota bacterium]